MLDELLLSGLRKDLEVALGTRLRSIVGGVESDTKEQVCFRCCYSVMGYEESVELLMLLG